MNSRQRVLCALGHREPDRVPLDLGVGNACKMHVIFYRRLLDHFGMTEDIAVSSKFNQCARTSDAMLERLECDMRSLHPTIASGSANPNVDWEDASYYYYRDAWGTEFRMPKDSPLYFDMCGFPLADADPEAVEAYKWPGFRALDPRGVRQAKNYRAAGYPVVWTDHYGNGFLQTGPRLFNFDNWLAMLSLEEDLVRGFLDTLLGRTIEYFDAVTDMYGDALDIVSFADDLGMQNSPFVSPDMFRDLFKPYWKKLFAHVKDRSDARIFLHSCGSCEAMLGDLVEVGLDIINPVQISAANMDPAHLKREYGGDLTFWGGGVDTQNMLPRGKPAEIRDHVKRNLDIFRKDGGYVFAAVHNVQADVPVENFMAMWETFMENRDY